MNYQALITVALAFCLSACAPIGSAALKDNEYKLHYVFTIVPEKKAIDVEIHIEGAELIRSISFKRHRGRHSDFQSESPLKTYKSTIRWEPDGDKAVLKYRSRVTRKRGEHSYQARITKSWALFRGDKIVPTAKVRTEPGAFSKASLEVRLPKSWRSVDTGWPKTKDHLFRIDNPERRFDRPIGWMIAGDIGIRRDQLGDTEIAIAAPVGQEMQRMNALTLINLVWPEAKRAFGSMPEKILIVGAGDPMWRGGLSASNSFYIHAERPLVSENGTSTLLHELSHVLTRVRGQKDSDWIAEGLAEYYSIELTRRAGAMNEARFNRVLRSLERWGGKVTSLRVRHSTGAVTARAVLLLHELDQELQGAGKGLSIDDLTKLLIKERKVSTKELKQAAEHLLGTPSITLDTALLK